MYQPNRDTHVPTIILSQNTYIFLQLNIDKYVPTQQIHTRTLRLVHVQTTEHINSYVPTQQIHRCTNQNTDLFIQLNIESYVPTKQRHTRTNKSFD